jgi:hypothetical protein
MKKIIIIASLSILIVSAGCGGNETQNAQPGNAAIDSLQQKHESENNGEKTATAGKLILNNGAKWRANTATIEGIQKMQSMVNDYLKNGNTDNKTLSGRLEKEFTSILLKCTMTGVAHEQLHNFLLPLKEKIRKLKEMKNVEAVKDIQSYLNNFYNYFE